MIGSPCMGLCMYGLCCHMAVWAPRDGDTMSLGVVLCSRYRIQKGHGPMRHGMAWHAHVLLVNYRARLPLRPLQYTRTQQDACCELVMHGRIGNFFPVAIPFRIPSVRSKCGRIWCFWFSSCVCKWEFWWEGDGILGISLTDPNVRHMNCLDKDQEQEQEQ